MRMSIKIVSIGLLILLASLVMGCAGRPQNDGWSPKFAKDLSHFIREQDQRR